MWASRLFSTAWPASVWLWWTRGPERRAIGSLPRPGGTASPSTSSTREDSTRPPAAPCRPPDAFLLVVDVVDGVTAADSDVAQFLRRQRRRGRQPRLLVVVNKCDSAERRQQAADFYSLGMGDPIPISALHGLGVGDLLDQLTAALPPGQAEEEDSAIRIPIVGRPNGGQSPPPHPRRGGG